MGTTNPSPPPFEGGKVLFWKLNAEAFLASSGIPNTIIKPCGLGTGKGQTHHIGTGHNDKTDGFVPIAREDVAGIATTAVLTSSFGLRFDVCCNLKGSPPSDYASVL